MQVLIVKLTQKSKGRTARSEQLFHSTALSLGRATSNDLHLNDFRIALQQATLTFSDKNCQVTAAEGAELRVNGAPKSSAPLHIGDSISMGPYVLTLVASKGGADFTFTLEESVESVDDLAKLQARSTTSLTATALSKRGLSWFFFVSIVLLFLAWPLGTFFTGSKPTAESTSLLTADKSWQSGPIARVHSFFADRCQTCHQKAFHRVADSSCTACHKEVTVHAPQHQADLPALSNRRCASCHKEHNGDQGLISRDNRLCSDCHAELPHVLNNANVAAISDFDTDHPQFSILLPEEGQLGETTAANAEIPASLLQNNPQLIDKNTAQQQSDRLIFPHDKHLQSDGIDSPSGRQVLTCASCHLPEAGGLSMLPITMEQHCQQCHGIAIEQQFADRQVPHTDMASITMMLKEFYAHLALSGQVTATEEWTEIKQRRPGAPLSAEQQQHIQQWLQTKVATVSKELFSQRACVVCHQLHENSEAREGQPRWQLLVPSLADKGFRVAHFNHQAHQTFSCQSCHQAIDSDSSADILIPGIENCRQCHADQAAPGKLQSSCVDCHAYHQP